MRNMIAANATLETRASSFGVGGFAYSALERDGWFSTPGFSVLSHRAHEFAPSFSLLVPTAADQDGVLLRIAAELNAATAGDFSSLRAVAQQGTAAVEGLPSLCAVAQQGSAAVDGLPSSCLSVARRYLGGDAVSLTCLCEARHFFSGDAVSLCAVAQQGIFTVDGLPSITVTAPWFRTTSRRAVSAYRPTCRCEAGHCLSGGLVLPKFGRALRL